MFRNYILVAFRHQFKIQNILVDQPWGTVGRSHQVATRSPIRIVGNAIIANLVVHKQIVCIRSGELGFEKQNIVVFPVSDSIASSIGAVKSMARQIAGVEQIGLSASQPYKVTRFVNDVTWSGRQDGSFQSIYTFSCDETFLETLSMSLIEGRNFEPG